MNVSVSVLGRFHAFHLARELYQHECLDRLVTSYPAWHAARWGVPKERIRSLWPVEAARRIIPDRLQGFVQHRAVIHDIYDRLASRTLSARSDVVVAWSGSAEKTLQKARALGAVTVVERGSAHIRTQCNLLRDEYERQGLQPDLPSPAIIEREEREYALADRIAIPSSFVEQTFLDQGVSPNKLIRIPYGVDLEEFESRPKEDDVFRVVFAGPIGVRKGVKYLLEAYTSLDLAGSELLLLGTVRDEARSWLNHYGHRQDVKHPGHVPHRDLDQWYSQGAVFVLPSVEDGFGMVLSEAMACGIPIIATPHTGAPDLIREGEEGFIVPVGDVEALRDRLVWCYRHRQKLDEMGHAARRRVLSNFTWRDYGERVVPRYADVLASER